MLRYINQKQHFTLQDLMQEFQISKRTALRDISVLEEIGAPIYAEYGRYGGYRMLNQIQLPPISFNSQEVYALYFAMQALQSFTSLPFQISFRSIHEKFLNELTESQKEEIERMRNRVFFRHTEQIADSTHLETLLTAAVKCTALSITYQKPTQTSTRTIVPIAIYSMKGFWYCQAYDMIKKAYRVFRCDRISSAEITDLQAPAGLNEITMQNIDSLWQPSDHSIRFTCLVDQKGSELFQQENYPSMKIIHEGNNMYIVGTYEPNELDFMVEYFASYGKSIKILEPTHLKKRLRQHYEELLRCL